MDGTVNVKNTGQRKGGFAHGGCQIYTGGAFPEKYHGQAYMGNIHHHLLYMDKLERKGSVSEAHMRRRLYSGQ